MIKKHARLLAVLATTLVGALATPTPASAAPQEPAKHCVTNLTTGATRCFPTFSAAIADVTHGEIANADALPALTPGVGLRDRLNQLGAQAAQRNKAALAAGSTTMAEIVVAVNFEHTGHDIRGRTYIWTGDHPCDDGPVDRSEYWLENLTYDWNNANDKISSFYGAANCWQQSYEHAGWSGRTLSLRAEDGDLNQVNFNDIISSLRLT